MTGWLRRRARGDVGDVGGRAVRRDRHGDRAKVGADADGLAGGVGGDPDRRHGAGVEAGGVGGLPVRRDRDGVDAPAHPDGLARPVRGGADRGHRVVLGGHVRVGADVERLAVRRERDGGGGGLGTELGADRDGLARPAGGGADRGDRIRAEVGHVGGLPVGRDDDGPGIVPGLDGPAEGAAGDADRVHLVGAGHGDVSGLAVAAEREGIRAAGRLNRGATRRPGPPSQWRC